MSFKSWSSGLDTRGKAKASDRPSDEPAPEAVPSVKEPSPRPNEPPAIVEPPDGGGHDGLAVLARLT